MDNTKQYQPSARVKTGNPLSRESRGAFAISLMVTVFSFIGLVYTAYQTGSTPVQSGWILVASMGLTFAGAIASTIASRQGRPAVAGWILTLAFSQLLVVRSLLVRSDFTEIAIAGFALIIYVGARIMPQSHMKWTAFWGILILLVTRLLGVISPFAVESSAFTNLGIQYLAWIVLISISLLLLREFRFLSLTNKLILAFLAVAFLVTFTMNYFSSARTEAALTERVGQTLAGLAESQGQAVGNLLNNQIDNLLTLASSTTLLETLIPANLSYSDNPEENVKRIENLTQKWETSLSSGDTSNELILSVLENKAARELRQFLKISPYTTQLTLTDTQGGLVASTDSHTGYYHGNEYWWNAAYQKGKGAIYISAPFYHREAKKSVLQFAIPITDPATSKIAGILQTTYLMDGVAGVFADLQPGETGNVHLLIPSKSGFPTYPRIPTRVMREGLLDTADMSSVEKIAKLSDQPYGELNYMGQDSFYSWAYVKTVSDNPIIENLGWWLLTYQDRGEILAPVREQTQQSGLLSAVIVAVVAAMALLFSQFLAGPIVRLTHTAEEIRKGDLAARANIETDDEVGTLATSFNEMTGQLQLTLQNLELQVEERTKELELAGDVGQTLAQERDLDRLLINSVKLVQESFGLYHTQIYLLDAAGKALILRAATGEAGQEMLRRAHRLSVGGGSINGLAASQKQPVLVSDTSASPIFRANPMLPETKSELAVPLRIGERVVGVLDVQSSVLGSLSQENLPAFEALAGQLAIAVENANLIRQTQQAQEEVLNQTRHFTRKGWDEYLDAIERKERIGFTYDRQTIQPIEDVLMPEPKDEILSSSIEIIGEPVGKIMLEKNLDENWSESERGFVRTIADQIARQIDSLRLLSQTEQFRVQAEESARQLTRQGWDEYLHTLEDEDLGYTYDQLEITPTRVVETNNNESVISQPFNIRGEAIGEMVVEGFNSQDEESLDLIQAISDRLTSHIENLRLSAQTQRALQETEALYDTISRMNSARGYQEILSVLIENTRLSQTNPPILMAVFDKPLDDETQPRWCIPVASRALGQVKMERRYPFEQLGVPFSGLRKDQPVILHDLHGENPFVSLAQTGGSDNNRTRLAVWVPLVLGTAAIGFVLAFYPGNAEFNDFDLQHLAIVAGQTAIAVQSQLLLERAQARAKQEQNIREVTAEVFSATDVHGVMKKTVEHVGRVLGSTTYIYLNEREAINDEPEN